MDDGITQLRFTEDEMRRSGGQALHQFGVTSTYKTHTHDFYELFLVLRGGAVHAVNSRTQMLTEGSLVLVRPWDIHKYEALEKDEFEIVNIGIPENVFLRICGYLDVERDVFDRSPLPPSRTLYGSVLRDAGKKLLESGAMAEPEKGYRHMLSVLPYMVGLFFTAPEAISRMPSWFLRLTEQMDQPENFIAGLPRLLSLANISQEHLTRSFRRHLDITPTAFINGKRLSFAAELLLTEDILVVDLYERCGFNSQSYFYRLFTQRYGCSPKAFREMYRDRF